MLSAVAPRKATGDVPCRGLFARHPRKMPARQRFGRVLTLQSLPDDVIDLIISFLPKLAIRTLRVVSQFFRAAANRNFFTLQCDVANVYHCHLAFSPPLLSQLLPLLASGACNVKAPVLALPEDCKATASANFLSPEIDRAVTRLQVKQPLRSSPGRPSPPDIARVFSACPGIQRLKLCKLDETTAALLPSLSLLTHLEVSGEVNAAALPYLNHLTALQSLDLLNARNARASHGLPGMSSPDGSAFEAPDFPQLTSLRVSWGAGAIRSIAAITSLVHLQCHMVRNLKMRVADLTVLTALRSLVLRRYPAPPSHGPHEWDRLTALTALTSLELMDSEFHSDSRQLSSLSGLTALRGLTVFSLGGPAGSLGGPGRPALPLGLVVLSTAQQLESVQLSLDSTYWAEMGHHGRLAVGAALADLQGLSSLKFNLLRDMQHAGQALDLEPLLLPIAHKSRLLASKHRGGDLEEVPTGTLARPFCGGSARLGAGSSPWRSLSDEFPDQGISCLIRPHEDIPCALERLTLGVPGSTMVLDHWPVFAAMAWLTSLHHLSVNLELQNPLTGLQGQSLLGALTQLTHLRMGHGILSDACFEALAQVRSLQVLRVAPTDVTVSGLCRLSALTNLESCVLRCPLQNGGVKGDAIVSAVASVAASTSDTGACGMVGEDEDGWEEALKAAFAHSCDHWRARRWEMGWPLTYTELSFCRPL